MSQHTCDIDGDGGSKVIVSFGMPSLSSFESLALPLNLPESRGDA